MATETNLHEEFETLKEDVAKLRTDVGDLLSVLKAMGAEKVGDARESLDDELARRREELRAALKGARARGEHAAEALEGEITDHPMSSVIAAFGMGFLIAKLLDTGRHN
ncbi:MAG TPA: SIMPL domain-containing protein [Pseudomonadales bacterium]|nr:SIMPL domain-containing protein [Pseudomonadales bacterium]